MTGTAVTTTEKPRDRDAGLTAKGKETLERVVAELKRVIRSDSSAIRALTSQRNDAVAQKEKAEARVDVLEDEAVPGLEQAVKAAQDANQCTIALGIPCPPRWLVSVVSLAAGGAIVAAVSK